jgi:hypothetical protein
VKGYPAPLNKAFSIKIAEVLTTFLTRDASWRGLSFVMAGLVPAIHVLLFQAKPSRGCPAQGRA